MNDRSPVTQSLESIKQAAELEQLLSRLAVLVGKEEQLVIMSFTILDKLITKAAAGQEKKTDEDAPKPKDANPEQSNQVKEHFSGLPKVRDGKEQEAFEKWASGEDYDMSTHPLQYLFLDSETYSARQGRKAALRYVDDVAGAGLSLEKRILAIAERGAGKFMECPLCGYDGPHWVPGKEDREKLLRRFLELVKDPNHEYWEWYFPATQASEVDQIADIERRVANNQTVTEHELQLVAKNRVE